MVKMIDMNTVKKYILIGTAALGIAASGASNDAEAWCYHGCRPRTNIIVGGPFMPLPGAYFNFSYGNPYYPYPGAVVIAPQQVRIPPKQEGNVTIHNHYYSGGTRTEPARQESARTEPAISQRSSCTIGYSGRICPEQYVSEGNGLLNCIFEEVSRKGGERFHAYAMDGGWLGQHTIIRNNSDKIVAIENYSSLKNRDLNGQEFVNYVNNISRKIGISANDYVDINFSNHTPSKCSR